MRGKPIVPDLPPIVVDQRSSAPVDFTILRAQLVTKLWRACRVAIYRKQAMAFYARRRQARFEMDDQVCMPFAKLRRPSGGPQIDVDLGKKGAKLGDTLAEPQRGQCRFCTDGQSTLLCRPEKIAARVA